MIEKHCQFKWSTEAADIIETMLIGVCSGRSRGGDEGICIPHRHNRNLLHVKTRSIWKMLGPFATASRRYIHQVSLVARQL